MHNNEHDPHHNPRTPLWKWILIIILVIAMPLFFSLYRNLQTQNAINATNPTAQQTH
jgi:hypothetical protein